MSSTNEKFPQLCDVKKVGIYTGYVFYDGLFTCEDEEDALNYAKNDGYASLDEAYDDEAYYYTEWEEIDGVWFEETDGVWFECTEDSREPVK
jgi:hypothetical protein